MPLYHRLYLALAERIASGVYPPGGQLPTERSLVEEFRVSRQTVLAAMQRLTTAGLVQRYAGRGTFVVEGRAQPGRWTFDSLEDLIEAADTRRYSIVSAELIPVASEPRLRGLFGWVRDELVFHVRALRSSDDGPYSYSRIYLPRLLSERLPRGLLATKPLLRLLEGHAGITVMEARQLTSAVLADPDAAALLEVPEQTPLLVMRRDFFDENGRPVVHALVAARPDRYEQIVHFRRRDAEVQFRSPAGRVTEKKAGRTPREHGRPRT